MHRRIRETIMFCPFSATPEQFLGGDLLSLGGRRIRTAEDVQQELHGLL